MDQSAFKGIHRLQQSGIPGTADLIGGLLGQPDQASFPPASVVLAVHDYSGVVILDAAGGYIDDRLQSLEGLSPFSDKDSGVLRIYIDSDFVVLPEGDLHLGRDADAVDQSFDKLENLVFEITIRLQCS